MSAEWLKLETGKTVTTLRFLSTHLDLVEAERLKKRLYEEVGFL
jgi:endonuclease/exonuclease/phosphatase family metal-dependent hydrolase